MSYPEGLSGSDFCYIEGHDWGREGGGTCLRCGEQLRCLCGRFMRVDEMDAHIDSGGCLTIRPPALDKPLGLPTQSD